ncbi:hexosaminidase [Microdochium nivale]|nr:hexosaminidase [Microdochium nivale]
MRPVVNSSCKLLALALALLAVTPAIAVWPVPEHISTGTKVLWVDQSLHVTYNGQPLPWIYPCAPSNGRADFSSKQIVQSAVSRAAQAILEDNFVPWMLYARNALADSEPSPHHDKKLLQRLVINQNGTDTPKTFKAKAGEVDESYTLAVTEEGLASITAHSSIGVLRALESFSQLFFKHSRGSQIYSNLIPVKISDKPQYDHRGILFDAARSYFPVSSILKTIDAMSWNKLNRLHLHISDAQSWPMEVPSLPLLAEKGAYSPNARYTPGDLALIQSHAVERGVQVIIEIDTPGHWGITYEAYPDTIAAWGATPWQSYCAEPPCGQLKLNHPAVDPFLDTLMDDVLPRTAPFSAYHHTGGDEVNFNAFALEETVGTNDSAVIKPLLQKFFDKHHTRVRKHGLTPMVWEEVVLHYDVTLGDDVVVQSWLGGESVKNITAKGHKVITSNYNFWYLDCGRGHWLNFANGDAFDEFFPFNDWCTPAKGWRLMYSYDPRAGLSEEAAKLVIGGEAAGWSEYIDQHNIDTILWPRASAMGEVLWSGRIDLQTGQNRSQLDAAPRLAEFRERMVARGVGSAPVHMPFCTQGMNATACEYVV